MKVKLRIASVLLICACCIALAACAPSQPSEKTKSSEGEGSTELIAWTPASDCASCHAKQSDTASPLMAVHEVNQCTACHADTAGLEKAHEKVTFADTKGAKRLKATQVSQEACLTCHADDYTPEMTAAVTVLTDKNGTTVNPHDLPMGEGHKDITCGSCHAVHESKTSEESAQVLCKSCHHEEVYECGTCHE